MSLVNDDVMSQLKLGGGFNNTLANLNPTLNIVIGDKPEDKTIHWTELKVKDRFINKRSYQAAVIYESKLYVYGGQDLNVGIYSDFNCIRLNDDFTLSHWENVEVKGTVTPGPLSRMANVLIDHKWYLFGGTSAATKNNSNIWCFDFKAKTWTLIKPASNIVPPPMDTHTACYYKDGHGRRYIVAFGGFIGGTYGEYWNQVAKYSLDENKWILPYDPNKVQLRNNKGPNPRSGHTANIHNDKLYIFGGTDGEYRFSDIWKYDLIKDSWQLVKTKEPIPPRNGHTSIIYNERGFVTFGGIQDITHEKDDVLFFDFNKEEWRVLDGEFDYCKVVVNKDKEKEKPQGRFNRAKSIMDNSPMKRRSRSPTLLLSSPTRGPRPSDSPAMNRKGSPNSPIKTTNNSFALSQSELRSPGLKPSYKGLTKENEDKKKKLFLVRKQHFLKEFEITDPTEMLNSMLKSPTTEAMKNSIIAMNYKSQPDQDNSASLIKPKKTSTLFSDVLDETAIKVKMPINGKLNGHKPCARDGHSAFLYHNCMVIFGGDRNKMSFNDIYVLNLEGLLLSSPSKDTI